MRRFFLYCLLSLPVLVHAETDESASIPAPPELSVPGNERVVPDKKAAVVTKTNAPETTRDDTSIPLSATPEPPDLPMPVQSGENLEPDITIIRRGQETIQEFRNNGVVYMVKIVPDLGPAYYLIDSDGDGKLDVQRSDLDRGTRVNMWKIFEWK